MEELKLQLGDRMPNALGLAAQAMNMTNGEFIKLVSTGKLASDEFMPKFANKLREVAREGGALEAALNSSRKQMDKFGTAFQLNIGTMFEEGMEEGLGSFFKDITAVMEDMAPTFKVLGRVVDGFFSILGTGIHAVHQVFRPFVAVIESFTSSATLMGNVVLGVTDALAMMGYVALIPFGIMERLNSYVQSLTGAWKDLGSVMVAVINSAFVFGIAKMLGLSGALIGVVKGIKVLALTLWTRLIPALTALALNPVFAWIAGITAAVLAIKGLYDYFSDNPEQANNVAASQEGKIIHQHNTITVYANDEEIEDKMVSVLDRVVNSSYSTL